MNNTKLAPAQAINIYNHLHCFQTAEREELRSSLIRNALPEANRALREAALRYAETEVSASILPPQFEVRVIVDGWAECANEETTFDMSFEEALANGVRLGAVLATMENEAAAYGVSLAGVNEAETDTFIVERVAAKMTLLNGGNPINLGFYQCVQEALVTAMQTNEAFSRPM